jgi:hypothetical protein
MLIQFVSAVLYFKTRDDETILADVPILSSLASTVTSLLIATAALGEFIKSSTDANIVFLGFALAYIIALLVMGFYWLYSTTEFLYNKFVVRVL